MRRLTDEQVIILGAADKVGPHHSPGRWIEPHQVTWLETPLRRLSMWHALARRGLLDRIQQSENVRGEGRMRWWLFRTNAAGRKAVEDHHA